MPRFFINLAYRGAPFHGWQTQPRDVSVQQTLEKALAVVMRCPVPVTGAGRTDAGVNARRMIAHFDLPGELGDKNRVISALNSLLGGDIAVYDIVKVHDEAHARFDAVARTYHYYAAERKSPFFSHLSWKAPKGLDYEAMNEAASLLLTVEDFTSFSKLHTDVKTNICNVTEASWRDCEFGGKVFVITADRFLRNMVRAVVGTLVDVGRGKLTTDGFRRIIEARDRCAAGTSMPGHALYLWDVRYPYISFD